MGLKNKRVLITCGPTWTAIDPVRVLSNVSSGAMGLEIATAFMKAGASVTMIKGPVHLEVSRKIKVIEYKYFDELFEAIRTQLKKKVDVVIHAAAVADYRLKKSYKQKIGSEQKHLKLELVPTPKIINVIKTLNPKVQLIGFKLEPHLSERTAFLEAKKLFEQAGCDVVVANSLNNDVYRGFILEKQKLLKSCQSRKDVAAALVKILGSKL